MKFYYRHPKNDNLIIFESDDNSILILERIKSLQVFLTDDLESPVRVAGTIDGPDNAKRKTNFPVDLTMPKQKTVKNRKVPMTPEIINRMKFLEADGKSITEISEMMGMSYQNVWGYLRRKPARGGVKLAVTEKDGEETEEEADEQEGEVEGDENY